MGKRPRSTLSGECSAVFIVGAFRELDAQQGAPSDAKKASAFSAPLSFPLERMIEDGLNNRLVRIAVGTALGLPSTLLALVTGAHGLVLGYAGIKNGEPLLLATGLLTVTGLIGLGGAWARLLVPSKDLTHRGRRIVRFCLWIGVASSLGLGVWAIVENAVAFASIFVVIALVGVLFVYATPKAL